MYFIISIFIYIFKIQNMRRPRVTKLSKKFKKSKYDVNIRRIRFLFYFVVVLDLGTLKKGKQLFEISFFIFYFPNSNQYPFFSFSCRIFTLFNWFVEPFFPFFVYNWCGWFCVFSKQHFWSKINIFVTTTSPQFLFISLSTFLLL